MRLLSLLLIALALTACATPAQVSQVRQDVSSVYGEQTNYRERTDERLGRIEAELNELQKTIGTPEQGLRRQLVDQSLAVENTNDKIRDVLGRLDELQVQLNTYWEEARTQLKELKKGRQGTATQSGPDIDSPDALYKKGFDAFQKGAYKDALSCFDQFSKENPESPLAPNAFYWSGEAYMNLNDYEKAIVQFQEVVDKFPKSEKAARAMVRQAEAFNSLKDKKSSITLLKRVIELFPKSEEARVAERMLRGGALK